MKKTYIIPATETTRLCTESALLADSLKIDSTKEAGEQWTQKKGGWSSDNWTKDAE